MALAPEAVTIGAVATLASSLTAAIISLKKVKPETDKTTVSVAGEAVIVQSNVIKDLNAEIERVKNHHEECEEAREIDRQNFYKALEKVRDECLKNHVPRHPSARTRRDD